LFCNNFFLYYSSIFILEAEVVTILASRKCVFIGVVMAMLSATAMAGRSTAQGQISVAQVMEMLDQAPTSPAANQLLTAYLAGLGEATGALFETGAVKGVMKSAANNSAVQPACKGRFSLDDRTVRQALEIAVPEHNRRSETAATPLIVQDMLRRAGCQAER
jgi:hypothetical protein